MSCDGLSSFISTTLIGYLFVVVCFECRELLMQSEAGHTIEDIIA